MAARCTFVASSEKRSRVKKRVYRGWSGLKRAGAGWSGLERGRKGEKTRTRARARLSLAVRFTRTKVFIPFGRHDVKTKREKEEMEGDKNEWITLWLKEPIRTGEVSGCRIYPKSSSFERAPLKEFSLECASQVQKRRGKCVIERIVEHFSHANTDRRCSQGDTSNFFFGPLKTSNLGPF